MHLVFDIFQGIGVAAAVGIRPFLPGLVAGALAAGDVELSFRHTHFHFLQSPVFLLIMVVGVVLVGLAERRFAATDRGSRPLLAVLAVCALVIGALFCGGAVARSHHSQWIGIAAGVVCAAIGIAATAPLLARVRARLDAEAGGLLPVLVDGAAALAAGLSIVAPPIGVILVAALLWLLIAGRGRSEQKYAGLRVLR
jgi:hypothetical protein